MSFAGTRGDSQCKSLASIAASPLLSKHHRDIARALAPSLERSDQSGDGVVEGVIAIEGLLNRTGLVEAFIPGRESWQHRRSTAMS